MLQSKLIGETYKEWPKEATLKSHGLLIKGGYIRQIGAGLFTMLPLAKKITDKIQNIIREEMNNVGAQEVLMPMVGTRKLWEMSGRYNSIGDEMIRFKDRTGSDLVLSMTHEEPTVLMAMTEGKSYQKYPFAVYQFQNKFRDEARSRGGLIRTREFVMKDAYSFHTSQEDLEKVYEEYYNAYNKIFTRVGLKEVIAVKSDSGMMGGKISHEYMLLTEAGEDKIITCDNCDYHANMEVAEYKYLDVVNDKVENLEKINTPNIKTIEDLEAFTGKKAENMMKAVCYTKDDDSKIVVCFIRADRDVNETKLTNLIKSEITPRKPQENDGICYGFIGPKKDFGDAIVVYDISLQNEKSLICGANEENYHFTGFNIEREIGNIDFVDIGKVKENDVCPVCGNKSIKISNGIEVGNIFQLGTKYTESMNMTYLDENGKSKNPIMGCYGIGIGRLVASILEAKATERACNWPASVAPFNVHVIALDYGKNEEVTNKANEIYETLSKKYDVLLDDRNKSAGVKFADADLIGATIRIVIGKKNLAENKVEIRALGEESTNIDLETIYSIVDEKFEEKMKECE